MRNRRYVNDELIVYKDFFDSISQFPLRESQRRAVVVDEKNNLVIARVEHQIELRIRL